MKAWLLDFTKYLLMVTWFESEYSFNYISRIPVFQRANYAEQIVQKDLHWHEYASIVLLQNVLAMLHLTVKELAPSVQYLSRLTVALASAISPPTENLTSTVGPCSHIYRLEKVQYPEVGIHCWSGEDHLVASFGMLLGNMIKDYCGNLSAKGRCLVWRIASLNASTIFLFVARK